MSEIDPQKKETKHNTRHLSPDLESEQKKALAEAVNNLLKGIPFIGPYITIVKLRWGWSGILLLIAGFLISVVLAFTGLLPDRVISDKYKSNLQPAQTSALPEIREYEVKPDSKAVIEDAVKNAKSKVEASGIALSFINPQTIAEKIQAKVNVKLIFTKPCGDMISKRMENENNPNANDNILNQIKRLRTYWERLTPDQRDLLLVKTADIYPTMIVAIIDNDLYAYFCPYGDTCTKSPVLVFKGYKEKNPENTAALFFENHYNSISQKAEKVDFSTAETNSPCSSSKSDGVK